MGVFDKFKRREPVEAVAAEHGIVVHFAYGSTDLSGLFALEDRLEIAIADAGVGELDGNEMALDGSDGFLYFYGPDADVLFASGAAMIVDAALIRSAWITDKSQVRSLRLHSSSSASNSRRRSPDGSCISGCFTCT